MAKRSPTQYLVDMDNENAEIDILAVRDWINREENHSGEWTSFPFLATLSNNCVGLANMDIYADHIRKTRINNEIEKLKTDIQYSNYQETVSAVQRLEIDLAKDEEGSMANAVSKTIDSRFLSAKYSWPPGASNVTDESAMWSPVESIPISVK